MSGRIIALFCGLWMMSAFAYAQSSDCKMTEEDLHPIIDRYNPFFTDKSWEDDSKTETARLDPHRLLIIRQKACIRHHVLFTLHIDPEAIEETDRFWITEMLVLMKRVYFGDPEYVEYKAKFEKEYIRQFLAAGLNTSFNFPINDRTFICKVERGEWGAKVKLESVKFLLEEKVNQPGISREKDDGWYANPQRR